MAIRGHWKAAGRSVVTDLAAVAGTLGRDLAGSLLAALVLDQPDIWVGETMEIPSDSPSSGIRGARGKVSRDRNASVA